MLRNTLLGVLVAGVLLGVVAWGAVWGPAGTAMAAGGTGAKWEYGVLTTSGAQWCLDIPGHDCLLWARPEQVAAAVGAAGKGEHLCERLVLNALGAEGWELAGADGSMLYLKRPK